jgi:hypothetical protein
VANGTWISKQGPRQASDAPHFLSRKRIILHASSFINSTAAPNEVQANFNVKEWSLETERQNDVSNDRDSV